MWRDEEQTSQCLSDWDIISAIILSPFHFSMAKKIPFNLHNLSEGILCLGTAQETWSKTKKNDADPQHVHSIPKITHSFCLIWIHDELISRIWLLSSSLPSPFQSPHSPWCLIILDKHAKKISFTSVKSNIINIRAQIVFFSSVLLFDMSLSSFYHRSLACEKREKGMSLEKNFCMFRCYPIFAFECW